MRVEVAVIDTSDRGVQVCLGEDERPFWIPRSAPGVEWSAPPEIGDVVYVRVPRWLCAKHQQLQSLRYQRSLAFHQTPGLDPDKAKGELPMANDAGRGALFRIPEDEKKSDKWPDYRGDITLQGVKWKLAGWVKEDKNGKKYLSLVAQPFEDRADDRRRQQPERGGPDFGGDRIPFAPEWR